MAEVDLWPRIYGTLINDWLINIVQHSVKFIDKITEGIGLIKSTNRNVSSTKNINIHK